MKPTTEGLVSRNFDIVCMSFEKENERGLKVVQGAEKNSLFNEEMIIKAEDGQLRSNNTLESANGSIIKFANNAFETIKQNTKSRKTENTKADREIR